jgi:hypothetical protein
MDATLLWYVITSRSRLFVYHDLFYQADGVGTA